MSRFRFHLWGLRPARDRRGKGLRPDLFCVGLRRDAILLLVGLLGHLLVAERRRRKESFVEGFKWVAASS